MTSLVELNLFRLGEQIIVMARQLLRDWLVLAAKLEKHCGWGTVADKMNGIIKGVLAEEVSENFHPNALADFLHLGIVRIKDVLLIGEATSHQDERADPLLDSGKNTADVCIVAVADVSD